MEIENLYEWNGEKEDLQGMFTNGRPQWFKLWVEKYAVALDIAHLDEDLDPLDKLSLFEDVGRVFINSLSYFLGHDEGKWAEYKPHTRDGRVLWNALKRDIDASYRDYDQRVVNGGKGGRPKRSNEE